MQVWDLQVGEPRRDGASEFGASTMDLLAANGIASYALDLRGMGGTRRDGSGWTTPQKSVEDVRDVLCYLRECGVHRPVLVGWSQGALIAQLLAQQNPDMISSVVLYGSIYNPEVTYPFESEILVSYDYVGGQFSTLILYHAGGSLSTPRFEHDGIVSCNKRLALTVMRSSSFEGAGPWRTGRSRASSTRRLRAPSARRRCAATRGAGGRRGEERRKGTREVTIRGSRGA